MKIDEYEFRGVPSELTDFKEDLFNLINFGKLSHQVVTTIPTWTARNGEAVLYISGNEKRWYFYLNNTWNLLSFSTQLINGWVSFSGTGTVAIKDSFNVDSITDNGVGDYTLNWTNTFNNVNYAVVSLAMGSGGTATLTAIVATGNNPLVGSVRMINHPFDSAGQNGNDGMVITVMATGNV